MFCDDYDECAECGEPLDEGNVYYNEDHEPICGDCFDELMDGEEDDGDDYSDEDHY